MGILADAKLVDVQIAGDIENGKTDIHIDTDIDIVIC